MTAPDGIDWARAHERLALAARALERDATPSPGDGRRLLEARARALAQPPQEEAVGTEPLERLVFLLAGERHAVETRHVLEVVPLGPLTRVPCTPAFVLGVASHRGRVLPIIDLASVLVPGAAAGELREVVAVEVATLTFGIASEGVEGIVTDELLAVVDLEALAAEGRLEVHDDLNEDRLSEGRELS